MHFSKTQSTFVNAIKDPANTSFETEEQARRMKIYQDLFFNNVSNFICNGFPVLHSLYSESSWNQLLRQFFKHHHCRSPYFVEISKEFVEYLDTEYEPSSDDPPFMAELAHYEWIELDVSVRKCNVTAPLLPVSHETIASSELSLSPAASLVSYSFPVHQISLDFQPKESEGQYYYLVYRDSDDGVNFIQLNAMSAYLASLIESQESVTFDSLLLHIAETMPEADKAMLEHGLMQSMATWIEKSIVLIN